MPIEFQTRRQRGPLSLWPQDELPVDRSALIVHYPDIPDNMAVPPGETIKLPTVAATVANCKITGLFDKSEWKLENNSGDKAEQTDKEELLKAQYERICIFLDILIDKEDMRCISHCGYEGHEVSPVDPLQTSCQKPQTNQ